MRIQLDGVIANKITEEKIRSLEKELNSSARKMALLEERLSKKDKQILKLKAEMKDGVPVLIKEIRSKIVSAAYNLVEEIKKADWVYYEKYCKECERRESEDDRW
jgi:H2-forming N5,N10-methylenetetrahydromethanopterin dehydrogenase-like enzyme